MGLDIWSALSSDRSAQRVLRSDAPVTCGGRRGAISIVAGFLSGAGASAAGAPRPTPAAHFSLAADGATRHHGANGGRGSADPAPTLSELLAASYTTARQAGGQGPDLIDPSLRALARIHRRVIHQLAAT